LRTVIRLSHDAANESSVEDSSRAVLTVIGGAIMPKYYFTIRSGDHEDDERCVVLQDVAAALDYACCIARELSLNKYGDPGLAVSVRNEMREIVLSVPFLAACA
jgi:hypothetical protein